MAKKPAKKMEEAPEEMEMMDEPMMEDEAEEAAPVPVKAAKGGQAGKFKGKTRPGFLNKSKGKK